MFSRLLPLLTLAGTRLGSFSGGVLQERRDGSVTIRPVHEMQLH